MPQDLTPTNDELSIQPPKAGDDLTQEPTSVNRQEGKKEESRPIGNEGDRTQGS